MKKLSLNAPAFKKGEILTRTQLKKFLGGNGSIEDPPFPPEGDDDGTPEHGGYQCCWSHATNICSFCHPDAKANWKCSPGAVLVPC